MKPLVRRIIAATLVLATLSQLRLKIPRDLSKEKDMDNIQIAQAYNQYSRSLIFKTERKMAIGELIKYSPQGVLLDAGCGPGYLAAAIARAIPNISIIGLDISSIMLRIAQKNILKSELQERINLLKADVQELPLNNNSIDFIVSTGALHHWQNPDRAIQEFYRVLKPGGRFLVLDPRRDIPALLYPLAWLMQRFFMPEGIRCGNGAMGSIWSSFTPKEIETLLAGSPFPEWSLKRRWAWFYMMGKKAAI